MAEQKKLNALVRYILQIDTDNDNKSVDVLILNSYNEFNDAEMGSSTTAVQSNVYTLMDNILEKQSIPDETLESAILNFIEELSILEWGKDDGSKQHELFLHANQVVDDIRFAANQLKRLAENKAFIKEQVRKIQVIQDKIYGEVIAILGVFTAITFALFGGFSAIGSVANALKNPKRTLFGYELIGMALLFLFIYLIIVVLFNGIFKITNRDEIREYLSKGNKVSMKKFGYPLSTGFTCGIVAVVVFIVLVGIGLVMDWSWIGHRLIIKVL